MSVKKRSHIYETPPWGFTDQAAFLNQVVQVETYLKPEALLAHLKRLESALGRVPTFQNGPRLIDIDILFFDLPGTVNTPGILKALAGMHHIFTPITADRLVMESTLIFTQLLQDVIMKKGATSIETINLFWNQVDGRESTPLYKVYNQLIEQLGLSLMESQIKNSTRFRKESEENSKTVFRSTVMPPDERLMKACQLDIFMNEFLKIIQLQPYGERK